jgi:hypothetical protein
LSFHERSSSNDSLSIKVKRHNATRNAIRKFFGLADIDTAKNVSDKLVENYVGKGYLTAKYAKYYPEDNSYADWVYLAKDKPNLMTNAGITFLAIQAYGGNSGGSILTNGGNFVGVTATAITPARTDTDLGGSSANELTTNGFARAQGTVAPSPISGASLGAVSFTITNTFTASATQNNVQGSGLFTAAGPPTAGTMMHEATFTSTNFSSGDKLQIVWTISLSS